jgi:Iron-containing redox enzyme
MDTFTETIRLAPTVYLQVSAQKFRLYRLLPWEVAPGIETLQQTGDTDVARQMMAGAFYAGFPQRPADNQRISPPAPSLLRHIFSLAASYQTTRATPPTMRHVAGRLAARAQHTAAMHCLRVAEEESGHDTLALKDLAALGLPAHEFVAHLQPKPALALVELFTRFADADEPIAVLGYVYALERMALFSTEASIAAIERLIPAGIKATRCLRVHSAVGSDARHVAESIAFIATLPPQDRAAIARATYETISLQCAVPRDYPGDEPMRALLHQFGWAMDGTAETEVVLIN